MPLNEMTTPTYTICMCNYNMSDTIEQSLNSILNQLDKRYEVVIVDDGSTDNSLSIIKKLQKKYSNLRLIPLERDKNRKLGFTRNISIKEARGKYVLLHLDCDDIYKPHIDDFVKVFHQIEQCIKHDILVSGMHINMSKRDFLLEQGPYRNLFRAEDRDLWIRLAAINAYIPLIHESFVTRLPRHNLQRFRRSIMHTWDQILYDFRTGMSIKYFYKHEKNKLHNMSISLKVLRTLFVIPAKIYSNFCSHIDYPNNMNTFEKIKSYRDQNQGNFSQILERNNCIADFSVLGSEGRKLFQHNPHQEKYRN